MRKKTPRKSPSPPSLGRRLTTCLSWDAPEAVRTWLRLAGPIALLAAAALALVAAVQTRHNAHPDEALHIAAAEYYERRWLPPRVGDPLARDSYSRYGYSYLDTLDVVYFFAGKFSRTVSPLIASRTLRLRLFNVLLLFVLGALWARRWPAGILFPLLLMSPQIWYVFAYFNADAFPLALAMLTAHQLGWSTSALNAFLGSRAGARFSRGGLATGVLLGLLAVSKMNYAMFVLFAFCWLFGSLLGAGTALALLAAGTAVMAGHLGWAAAPAAWGLALPASGAAAFFAWRRTVSFDAGQRARLRRLLLVLAAALAVFLPRYLADAAINGGPSAKRAEMLRVADRAAQPGFRPSEAAAAAFDGVRMREKGVSFAEMFRSPYHWHIKTAYASVGVYGWNNIYGSRAYYRVMLALWTALLSFLCLNAVLRPRDGDRTPLYVGAFAAALLFMVAWSSWVTDFQAQGRYLFPILAMLTVHLGTSRERISEGIVAGFALPMFLLSCASFLLTGLRHLPG